MKKIFIPFTSKCRGLFSLHVSGSLIHIAIHQGLGFLDTAFFGLRFQHGKPFFMPLQCKLRCLFRGHPIRSVTAVQSRQGLSSF